MKRRDPKRRWFQCDRCGARENTTATKKHPCGRAAKGIGFCGGTMAQEKNNGRR